MRNGLLAELKRGCSCGGGNKSRACSDVGMRNGLLAELKQRLIALALTGKDVGMRNGLLAELKLDILYSAVSSPICVGMRNGLLAELKPL